MSKASTKARQDTLFDLKASLGLAGIPLFETIWLDPDVIHVPNVQAEGLMSDADHLTDGMELFGLGQDPAVWREMIPGEDGEPPTFVYHTIYGRRRILSARILKAKGTLKEIEVHCYIEALTADQISMLTLLENLNRRPAWIQTIDEVGKLLERGWSPDRIYGHLHALTGIGRGTVQSYIRNATMHPTLLHELLVGRLSESVAHRIGLLSAEKQAALVERVETEGIQVTADVVKDLLRVQVAPVLQEALLSVPDITETPAPMYEGDSEGLAAQFAPYDEVFAASPRYSKARQLLTMLVKELERVEAQS